MSQRHGTNVEHTECGAGDCRRAAEGAADACGAHAVRAKSNAAILGYIVDTTRRTVVWVAQDRLSRKLVLLVWNAHLLLHLLWAMLFEVAEDHPVFLS